MAELACSSSVRHFSSEYPVSLPSLPTRRPSNGSSAMHAMMHEGLERSLATRDLLELNQYGVPVTGSSSKVKLNNTDPIFAYQQE